MGPSYAGTASVEVQADSPLDGYHSSEVSQIEPRHKRWILWAAAFLSVGSAVAQMVILKAMNRTVASGCANCEPGAFQQPWLQTVLRFFAQATCLPLWWLDQVLTKRLGRKEGWLEGDPKPPGSRLRKSSLWWWTSPAVFDLVGNLLCFLACSVTYASTVQVLCNQMVITVALTQLWLTKRPLLVHEWLGVVIIWVSIVISSISAVHSPDTSAPNDLNSHDARVYAAWQGVVFALIGTAVVSIQIVWEEFLFVKGYISLLQAIGIEGIAGAYLNLTILPIIHESHLSNVFRGLYQITHNARLGCLAISFYIVGLLSHGSELHVSKTGPGLLRSILYISKTPLVWIMELSLGWRTFDKLNLGAVVCFLAGFALLTLMIPLQFSRFFDQFLLKPVKCGTRTKSFDVDEYDFRCSPAVSAPARNVSGLMHTPSGAVHAKSEPRRESLRPMVAAKAGARSKIIYNVPLSSTSDSDENETVDDAHHQKSFLPTPSASKRSSLMTSPARNRYSFAHQGESNPTGHTSPVDSDQKMYATTDLETQPEILSLTHKRAVLRHFDSTERRQSRAAKEKVFAMAEKA